jgi:hypothetical protein
MSMRGHSAMVAILAITGRFNLRTTGRAVMFLTVKKASDIATPHQKAPFQRGQCQFKFGSTLPRTPDIFVRMVMSHVPLGNI